MAKYGHVGTHNTKYLDVNFCVYNIYKVEIFFPPIKMPYTNNCKEGLNTSVPMCLTKKPTKVHFNRKFGQLLLFLKNLACVF